MRLYKKAAACLLTAAMALSMLTACGGGGTGGGEGTETKPTKTPIDKNKSKLAKFNNEYGGFKEFYVEMQEVAYEDGSVEGSTDGFVAVKGNNAYTKMTLSGKNQKQQLVEQLMLKEFDYNNDYLLLRGSKVAVRTNSYKSQSDDNLSLDTLIANKLPSQMWSTEVKVGPTKYYAEVYNLYSYEYTTCFTADGKPVYQFVRSTALTLGTIPSRMQTATSSPLRPIIRETSPALRIIPARMSSTTSSGCTISSR